MACRCRRNRRAHDRPPATRRAPRSKHARPRNASSRKRRSIAPSWRRRSSSCDGRRRRPPPHQPSRGTATKDRIDMTTRIRGLCRRQRLDHAHDAQAVDDDGELLHDRHGGKLLAQRQRQDRADAGEDRHFVGTVRAGPTLVGRQWLFQRANACRYPAPKSSPLIGARRQPASAPPGASDLPRRCRAGGPSRSRPWLGVLRRTRRTTHGFAADPEVRVRSRRISRRTPRSCCVELEIASRQVEPQFTMAWNARGGAAWRLAEHYSQRCTRTTGGGVQKSPRRRHVQSQRMFFGEIYNSIRGRWHTGKKSTQVRQANSLNILSRPQPQT